MPRVCLCCQHAETQKIDKMIVDNVSIREISQTFEIPYHSVDRHKKNHLAKSMTKAKQAEEVAEATTLLFRVEKLMSRVEIIAEKAMEQQQWMGAVAASKELRCCLELLGKLSGELQTGARVAIGIRTGNPREQLVALLDVITNIDKDDLEPLMQGLSDKHLDGMIRILEPETREREKVVSKLSLAPVFNVNFVDPEDGERTNLA